MYIYYLYVYLCPFMHICVCFYVFKHMCACICLYVFVSVRVFV